MLSGALRKIATRYSSFCYCTCIRTCPWKGCVCVCKHFLLALCGSNGFQQAQVHIKVLSRQCGVLSEKLKRVLCQLETPVGAAADGGNEEKLLCRKLSLPLIETKPDPEANCLICQCNTPGVHDVQGWWLWLGADCGCT